MAEIANAPVNSSPPPATETRPTDAEKELESPAQQPEQTEPSGEAKESQEVAESAEVNGDASPEKPSDPEASLKANGDSATATVGTPASSKKGKRKSTVGVPEHKSRKSLSKKKSTILTHLNAEPGQYYFASLRGHPPWPAIICDEEMLPQNLLTTRPVTAKRPDGTYRDEFADGGKRATERTYPVMYLYTNEFGWMPNTGLSEINLDTIGEQPEKGKSKSLFAAYKVAAEKHDLDHWKKVLREHQEALIADAEEKAAAKAKKASKGKNKAKPVVEDEDHPMEDAEVSGDADEAEGAEPKKQSKKRKKATESEADDSNKTPKKPKGTPTLKLSHPKTPNGTAEKKSRGSEKKSAAKPKATSAKKAKAAANAASEGDGEGLVEEAKPETEQEKYEKKKFSLLFLRHKLQRGFLTRDQMPKVEEMSAMSDFMTQLEARTDLDLNLIRDTKVNKVLKGIIKLSSIPREPEFRFKERSEALLASWLKYGDGDAAKDEATPAAKTNGVSSSKTQAKGDEAAADKDSKPAAEAEAIAKEIVADDKKDAAAAEKSPADDTKKVEAEVVKAAEDSAAEVKDADKVVEEVVA